ncbi:uncharacterized protein LOC124540618 [Vanessa cardui]|uniref:uncharacterized protein LOC124540618 n=1 Tax=Vanessa cardui TaxID=171605 RepID=UPI001F14754A|nr:uncharacterized protein LOC124540618 [Vanessa cardui]
MKITLLFVILLTYKVATQHNGILSRYKRDSGGALNIVTNHAPAIHADVKDDNAGQTDKVTAPKDALYDGRSLRKSLPLTTKLDLVRAVSRVVTLITLLFSAIVEFYPFVQHMYRMIDEFINLNKY